MFPWIVLQGARIRNAPVEVLVPVLSHFVSVIARVLCLRVRSILLPPTARALAGALSLLSTSAQLRHEDTNLLTGAYNQTGHTQELNHTLSRVMHGSAPLVFEYASHFARVLILIWPDIVKVGMCRM